MVNLIECNNLTRVMTFGCDKIEELKKLPTTTTKGAEALSTIKNCAPFSMALTGNGSVYRLNGETNTWDLYE